MKILHTSDWHLGQEFYSYDRNEEHIAFLTQLKDIVSDEQPDVMVVSGDIYHNATPSNAVMRMFTDYVDAVRRACPQMKIVITAGNHDSSSRLEVTRSLWEHLGVYIVGKLDKGEDGVDFDRLIIPIPGTQNDVKGYIVALPYVAPQSFPLVEEDIPREERQTVFLKALSNRVEAINTDNRPVVMMAHMAIAGSDITGHDQSQGGMDYISASDLYVGFDYLALGHIHCPQLISQQEDKTSRIRYCGSPIPVSFDENYVHSVSIVEVVKHGDTPTIRTIPIGNPWPLRTFPKDAVTFEEALKELEAFPDDEQAYVRLHVRLTDVPPQNAMERASFAVASKKCRFCTFKWERPERETKQIRAFTDVDQMKSRSPLEIADLYYENKYGQPLDEDLKAMLKEVIDSLKETVS